MHSAQVPPTRTAYNPGCRFLMLERVRLLDIISCWAKGTHASYKSKLNVIKSFENQFDLSVLTPSPYFAKGMVERLGDQPLPLVALLDRHVRPFDAKLDAMFLEATTDLQPRDIALAGVANLDLWLGWLRSAECFGLNCEDASALEPPDSAEADLPTNCGMVSLCLNPVTKSDHARTAAVLLAYNTRSGLSIGKWFRRAKRYLVRPTGPIFCNINGTCWISFLFRNTYLYLSLHRQCMNGDPLLASFDGSAGNSFESHLWSLHCYRRGGRSHVSRGGIYGGARH